MRGCCLAILILLSALPVRAADVHPHVLLYVPFDDTANAAVARGNPERLRAGGAAGAAIADRLHKELDQLNYTKCRFILEEPAALDLLEASHASQR